MTTLSNNVGWFLGIFVFVALFTGSSLLFSGETKAKVNTVPFSDLTDQDVDYILSVKAGMQAQKNENL